MSVVGAAKVRGNRRYATGLPTQVRGRLSSSYFGVCSVLCYGRTNAENRPRNTGSATTGIQQSKALPGLWLRNSSWRWMRVLSSVRMGQVRLNVLAQRRRGARFLEHEVRSVLNPPESTGIGVWSLNPY